MTFCERAAHSDLERLPISAFRNGVTRHIIDVFSFRAGVAGSDRHQLTAFLQGAICQPSYACGTVLLFNHRESLRSSLSALGRGGRVGGG
jgi:hypothetical protein